MKITNEAATAWGDAFERGREEVLLREIERLRRAADAHWNAGTVYAKAGKDKAAARQDGMALKLCAEADRLAQLQEQSK